MIIIAYKTITQLIYPLNMARSIYGQPQIDHYG